MAHPTAAISANTRYSPLDQITAANFSTLESHGGSRPTASARDRVPIRVDAADGQRPAVYSTAGTRRAVVALDAATGELLWMHSEQEGARGEAAPRQLSGRGLAYWTDGKQERILYVTPGYRLVALDASTGEPVRGFGSKRRRRPEDTTSISRSTSDTARVGLHATPTSSE